LVPSQRHQKILALVRAAGQTSVDDLSGKLLVSKETIRRDLTLLDREGLLKKIHGGAQEKLSRYHLAVEGSFKKQMGGNIEEKKHLATLAAKLFKAGDALFIDTGSTTLALAEVLAGLPHLTIITNSLTIARTVSANPHHQVYVLGGNYQRADDGNVGIVTHKQIEKFHAHYAVLTVEAIEQNSVTDYNLQAAEVARAMIKQAQKTVIVADSSKFTKTSIFEVAPLHAIDYLVTNKKPVDDFVAALKRAQVSLIYPS